ncbi:hypothetical protein [Thiomicrorhabdus sediminis]|uniref:Uncharacterized protein n=1 Tax=Thiomicrorhabdus sediminis TaxID=2580412 RepID=A0A4P9K5U9_9GAMM|nr:hypothetical protein [Thiomicrorhabdus sediminis]QCU90385.1 hypothetical protein FE785_06945 [Thiomicrorhabdus sediminis]
MNQQKAKFSWHYYLMAIGALLALLAATLGAWGSVASGVAIAIISTPKLPFAGISRFVFYIVFFVLYLFAFPDPEVVREMMNSTQY